MAQMTFAEATNAFGLRETLRLIALASRIDNEGGRENYENGHAHKAGHEATVLTVTALDEKSDSFQLSCGHTLTQPHDDESASLTGSTTNCPHLNTLERTN